MKKQIQDGKMTNYEVVEYVRSRTIIFDKFEAAERYLEGIQEADIDNLYFIERDGEAIK